LNKNKDQGQSSQFYKDRSQPDSESNLQTLQRNLSIKVTNEKGSVTNPTDNPGDESVTEPDDDDEPTRPIKTSQVKETEAKSEGSSESNSEPPVKKLKVVPASKNDDSDTDSDEPVFNSTSKKRAPVRQPVKRGGKRW